MDWMTFVSQLVGSLAWPITALFIIYIFREPINNGLLLISRIKFKGIEIELIRQATELKEEAIDTTKSLKVKTEINTFMPEHIIKMVKISPRVGILEAWKLLENSIYKAANRCGIEIDLLEPYTIEKVVHELSKGSNIPKERESIFFRALAIRNQIAHHVNISFTQEQAIEIADAFNDLRIFFEKLSAV